MEIINTFKQRIGKNCCNSLFKCIPNLIYETIIKCKKGGRRGRNRMVVGFITTGIWIHNYLCKQCLSSLTL